ncbi:MAG: hypothetical protein NC828_00270 [Candidatus Omnitrophica bacterium]|nr:hypothetical protein [Candidatus Omnitrophota bacterium]
MSSQDEFFGHKLVQRYLLAHSDVATTLRYYVDVFAEDLEDNYDLERGEIERWQRRFW